MSSVSGIQEVQDNNIWIMFIMFISSVLVLVMLDHTDHISLIVLLCSATLLSTVPLCELVCSCFACVVMTVQWLRFPVVSSN